VRNRLIRDSPWHCPDLCVGEAALRAPCAPRKLNSTQKDLPWLGECGAATGVSAAVATILDETSPPSDEVGSSRS
jgi:hypothetical protein